MYPNRKCLEKETIGNHSKAIIGILIFITVLTFGLCIFGVRDYKIANDDNQQDDYGKSFVPENKPLEKKNSEEIVSESRNSVKFSSRNLTSEVSSLGFTIPKEFFSDSAILGPDDVPVPEKKCICDLDTEVGSITIVEESCLTEPLPLCITQDDLDDCNLVVEVVGGYEPLGGIVCIYQEKTGCGGLVCVTWTCLNPCAPCCEPKIWDADFTLIDGPICLESNHVPEVDGWCVIPSSQDGTLDKLVDISICTKWTGCEKPEQEFLVILAHKVMSQNPNSR